MKTSHRFVCGIALAGLLALTAATAAPQARIRVDLPGQPLEASLRSIGKSGDINILIDRKLVAGLRAPAVTGELSIDQAIAAVLQGSGLTYQFVNDNTVVLAALVNSDAAAATGEPQQTIRLTRVGNGAGAVANDQTPPASASARSDRTPESGEVLVTGSRIKGVSDRFSPITRVSRESMDLQGFGTVFEALDHMPQNFGGGTSPDTTTAGSVAGSGAAGINLRGLGNDATLILLNGRRLAAGGGYGNVTDVSSIPTSAIDRIEVLTDGASAIYGSDAIGGVVNIVMRKDYSGSETRVQGNMITDGDATTFKAGQTVGYAGERAHGIVTYEYLNEHALNGNDKDFSRGRRPQPDYLLPAGRRHTVFASGGAQMSERVEFAADGYYNDRATLGATSQYSQTGSTLQNLQDVSVKQIGAGAGITVSLPRHWKFDFAASFSESSQYAVTRALASGIIDDAGTSIQSVDTSLMGTPFVFRGESVKWVFGAHHRKETADILSTSSTGFVGADIDKQRTVTSGFSELYVPLPARIAFTAAARYDNYSDVGETFDPKFGLSWSPLAALSLRGTFGTAFRVARLEQLRDRHSTGLSVYLEPQGGTSVALMLGGNTSDMKPERAESWTLGFDLTPERLPGLRLRGTYFNIDYTDRIAIPTLFVNAQGQFNNFFGKVIRNPAAAYVQQLIATSVLHSYYPSSYPQLGPLDPANVTVILDRRTQNLSKSVVNGADLEFTYDLPTTAGNWTFLLSSTWLDTYTQQLAPGTAVADLLDSYGNPVGLKARGGINWSKGGVTLAAYANYVDSYTDRQSLVPVFKIDSWTTLDASVRLDLSQLMPNRPLAVGTQVSFTASNFLNQDPPSIGPRATSSIFYDAANSDPTGRKVGLLITKRW